MTLCFGQSAHHTLFLWLRVRVPSSFLLVVGSLVLRCLVSFPLGLFFLGYIQFLGPRGLSLIKCGKFGCALILPICC